MPHASPTTLQERIAAAIQAEPKKAAILTALALAMLVLLGRMIFSGGPAKSQAAATAVAARIAAAAPGAQAAPAGRAGVIEWIQSPIVPIGRNLFVVKLDYFPQDPSKISQTLREPSGNGFWDRLGKSMTARADQESRSRHLIENLRLQAEQLDLQSTLISQGNPRALVNGKLVREGDVVAEFRVLRIEARRIIVEREGIKLAVVQRGADTVGPVGSTRTP